MDISSTPAPFDTAWNRIGSTDMALVRDQQSRDIFSYTQIPTKFEHPAKCRNALGLVGGSEVSNIDGSQVDLESELLGITRAQSKCIARQYQPACPLGSEAGCPDFPPTMTFADKATGQVQQISTQPLNLPTCQLNTLPGVGYPKDLTVKTCYPSRF